MSVFLDRFTQRSELVPGRDASDQSKTGSNLKSADQKTNKSISR
jgi:hypothetical protein